MYICKMQKEIYKDVPGYEGLYQVSNYGNVLSFINGRYGLRKEPKLKKQFLGDDGYYKTQLRNNKKAKTFRTHQLVAMAFLGHKPDGHDMVVNHIDNNKLNNHANNLELVSNRYNTSCHKTDVGASWDKTRNKWEAKIRINGKQMFLGRFDNKEDALNIYKETLNKLNNV